MNISLQKQLKTLDLGTNFIPVIENISHLTSLEELWVRVFVTKGAHVLDVSFSSS